MTSKSLDDSRMPTPITYFPYSLSLTTRLEKSESPDSKMNVPISERVNTSSSASIANRMSVAFFLEDPYAGAKMRSIRSEIGVARQQDECADLRAREHELQRIDRQPNVGRVLLGGPVRRRENEVDRCFGQRHDVLRIAPPVGVRALHRDFAFDDVRREQITKFVSQVGTDPH